MEPRIDYIRQLVRERDWNGSEFAREIGISRAEANRFLNGKRKGGKKLIGGLLQAFPDETMDTLFFLPSLYPLDTTNSDVYAYGVKRGKPTNLQCAINALSSKTVPVKHPKARQLACTMNEAEGRIEIADGSNITTIIFAPSPIEVRHTTKLPEDAE